MEYQSHFSGKHKHVIRLSSAEFAQSVQGREEKLSTVIRLTTYQAVYVLIFTFIMHFYIKLLYRVDLLIKTQTV